MRRGFLRATVIMDGRKLPQRDAPHEGGVISCGRCTVGGFLVERARGCQGNGVQRQFDLM